MLALHHRSLAGFTLAVLPFAGTALAQEPSRNETTGTPRAIYGDGITLPDWCANTLERARGILGSSPQLAIVGSNGFLNLFTP